MKVLAGALLTVWLGGLVLAGPRAAMRMEAAGCDGAAETLKQLERDWAAAEQSGDSEKIDRIVADDWAGVTDGGRKLTKRELLEQIKRPKTGTVSVQFGPMDVKMLGDVAVVQGTFVEWGTANGEYTSGKQIWMDVFANRHGRWVAVRSQSARAGAVSRPRWPI